MATATVTCSSLNVRKGPGTNFSKLGVLNHNQTVTVTGQSGNWYKISYNGTEAYINSSSSYVKYSGGNTSGGSASTGSSSSSYQVMASTLNVRSGAGTNHSVIGTLNSGALVTSMGESNGWLKISYKGSVGWISKKFTKASSGGSSSGGDSSSGSSSAGTTAKKGTVTCSKLNVRSGAGTGHSVIGSLSNGESFSYTDESNGWLKISFGSGTGWISKSYTSVGGGASSDGGATTGGKASSVGQAIANKAQSLMSQYVSEKWTYSQAHRLSTGHYDCSSFAYRSCLAGGVNLNSNSEGQAKMIYNKVGEVSLSNIQPGDLIFFHNNWNSGTRWRGINHVAVAIGGGKRVDAGGTPVKMKDLSGDIKMIGRPASLA